MGSLRGSLRWLLFGTALIGTFAFEAAELVNPGIRPSEIVLAVTAGIAVAGSDARTLAPPLVAAGLLVAHIVALTLSGWWWPPSELFLNGYVDRLALPLAGVGAGVALRVPRGRVAELGRRLDRLAAGLPADVTAAAAQERARLRPGLRSVLESVVSQLRPRAEALAAGGEQAADAAARLGDVAREGLTHLRHELAGLRSPCGPSELRLAPRPLSPSREWTPVLPLVGLLALLGAAEQLAAPSLPFADTGAGGTMVFPAPAVDGRLLLVLAAAATPLPLLWVRRAPLAACLGVLAIAAVRLLNGDLASFASTEYALAMACAWSAALLARRALTVAAVVAAAIAVALGGIAAEPWSYPWWVSAWPVGQVLFATVTGLLARRWFREARRGGARLRGLAALHQRACREAVEQQRLAAARELHDVAGHALTVVAVQAGATVEQLAHGIDAPVEPLLEAITVAEREVRRFDEALAGLDLAVDPEHALEELLHDVRAIGVPLTGVRATSIAGLPPVIAWTVVRLVQEALTNVVRHAGLVETEVSLTRDGTVLRLVVENARGTGTIRGTGGGVRGMADRAAAVGGDVETGPVAKDRWRLVAVLPLDAPRLPAYEAGLVVAADGTA